MNKKELITKKQDIYLEELKDILTNGVKERRLEKLQAMIGVVTQAISNIEEYVTETMTENDFKGVYNIEFIASSITTKSIHLTNKVKEKAGYKEKVYEDGDTPDIYLRRKYEKEMEESLRLEDCPEDDEDGDEDEEDF